jgi:hypothetical protein
MNERIRELVKQANGYWEYGDFNIPHSVYFTETDLQKFAESIVRECSKISEDDITDGDACCTNTAYRIARQIKRHFGVKE